MARMVSIQQFGDDDFRRTLSRSFQSGNIVFLIGSGASSPAIPVAGPIEGEIQALIDSGDDDEASRKMCVLMSSVQTPTNGVIANLLTPETTEVLSQYSSMIETIGWILTERKTTLLPKQASIFTTNYDLFLEKAASLHPSVRLNDGFMRVPSLDGHLEFSTKSFFESTFNSGNLYNYRVEIPSINLLKLHGSLGWETKEGQITFAAKTRAPLPPSASIAAVKKRLSEFSVVFPGASKFRTTLLDRTYYELLRIYSNELDRENTLLVCFGFSFLDDHIRDITVRALKNPTLRVMIFAYEPAAATAIQARFISHSNVEVVTDETGTPINFARLNGTLKSILPRSFS